MTERTAKNIRMIIIAAIVLAVAALLMAKLSGIVITLAISAMLAYLLTKPLKQMEKKMKRGWALLILFGALTGTAALFFCYFVPLLIRQVADLAAYVPKVMQSISDILDDAGKNSGEQAGGIISQALGSFNRRVAEWLGNATINLAQGSYSGIGWGLMLPVFTFYFLKDREYFIDQFNYLIPVKYRKDLHTLYLSIDKSLGHFLRGQLLVSFSVAVMTTSGLLLIGVPNTPLLGLICGLCNLIPFLGPFIGVIPVAIVSASLGWKSMLFSVIVIFVVQQLDNTIISPKIIGDSLRIHPAYVIAAIIVGSSLFGIMGLLFALPALIVLKEIILFAFRKRLDGSRQAAILQNKQDEGTEN